MRHTIPASTLEPFKKWLISQDYNLETCKGRYEVLRWAGVQKDKPKPIIFKREHDNGILTINKEALMYYLDWKDGYE